MANKINIIISAEDKASKPIKDVSDQIEKSGDKTKKADEAFASFSRVMGTGLVVAAAAAVTGMGAAVKSAGDYESSLSQLKQASSATAGEMTAMSALTRQLGQDNDLAGVSASDAARTMVELSKAGLSVKDTMASSKAVMSLAKAGNIDFAEAATIAASALNAFGMEGKDAVKVADMLAAGANASQADLGDLAFGMQASATVAKQFGLGLNESVTALALFANNGIKGSDAGTSLKTMLIALAKPSESAATAMEAIGFKAYDAKGKFVGLEEMSKRLKKSTEKLTEEQKQNTLATIFGTDAFRAAAVLADNAGTSYTKMSTAVGKAGSAQSAAAAQMGANQRSAEGFKNSVSELGLTIGSKLLPKVTQMTNEASRFVQAVNGGIPGAISTFNTLLPTITSVSSGIVAFTVVQNAAGAATKALAVAQGALNFVMRANPLALAAGAAVAIGVAYVSALNATNGATGATERHRVAQEALTAANERAVGAQRDLTGAVLEEEGANLRVERAKRDVMAANAEYGPASLEAREASVRLKNAERDLGDATERVAQKTRDAKNAQEERSKAVEVVKEASKGVGNQVDTEAGKWKNLQTSINDAAGARTKGEVKSVVPSLTGNPLSKHALGTSYARGGATIVGENGPELVNMPRGSQVTQAYRTQGASDGGGVTNVLSGTFHFANAEASNAFFDRIDNTQRLAKVGM